MSSTVTPADILPLPHPLLQKIKDGLLALSLVNLCLLNARYRVLPQQNDLGYFQKLPFTYATLLGLAINMLGCAALVWLGIQCWRRCKNRWFRATCEWLFLFLLVLPLEFLREEVFKLHNYEILSFCKKPLMAVVLLFLLGLLLWQRRRIVRALAIFIGILSPFAFFGFGRIIIAGFAPQYPPHQFDEPVLAALSPRREGQPRILWIIFDELEQRLAFEQRPADLRTPEFDRLAGETLVCTNAYPPAGSTMLSIPGLTMGACVSSATPKGTSDLTVTFAESGEKVEWGQAATVFSSARELGMNTALVGWFHPYSRVLGHSLNYCSWYPAPGFQPTPGLTVGQSVCDELACVVWPFQSRRLFRNLCQAQMADSLCIVTNTDYGLMFLHLGPPHWPGVFDPANDRFTLWDNSKVQAYFNNVMLADKYLGSLRRALENSSQWAKTWLIVSADHSWRWSQDYDGRRDSRIPFLIKAPGFNQPAIYSQPVNTAVTRDLILDVLRGEISTQQQVATFLRAHPFAVPPPGPTAVERTPEDP